ncbi:uncharacterized protein BDV17DRAFT_287450 [Aspergillus undulatus]|uniref:uncharacterized protein n=1 Tax=Aspergillus undulatus TaxID=1810928 RepID=UPI003CCE1A68
MSDDNADARRGTLPLRHRDTNPAVQQPAPGLMSSSDADPEGSSSPRRSRAAFISDDGSMTSNPAQHSTAFSYTNAKPGSSDWPDEYASDAPSDQVAEIAPSTRQQGLRQPRKAQGPRPGTPRSRAVSRTAVDNRTGKASPAGSESRLRYSVNSTDDLGSNVAVASQPQHHLRRSSPDSNDERPPIVTTTKQNEISSLSRATGESTEGPSYGQESAGQLSKEQRSAGGVYAVDGGTAFESILLQVETELPTEEQLTNDVRGIYSGLVMVEKKCMEYVKEQSQSKTKLSDRQWQVLIGTHGILLQEHHDFLLASQHPAGNPVLKRLAEKYAMPSRLWRYGIHSLLELLRHRLPDALEHMITFIYRAYAMMTLLLESAPAFEFTWTECLGDLSRYGMAVEEADFREREVWAGIARYWYNKAADLNPEVGRIQHHLAVLARPDVVQQLFYYTKSAVCVHPYAGTRESIFLLFNPVLKAPKTVRRLPEIVAAFVAAHGYLFIGDLGDSFMSASNDFLSFLEQYIGRMGPTFKLQGVYIASCNFAAVLEYATPNALLPGEFSTNAAQSKSMDDIYFASHRFWTPVGDLKTIETDFLASRDSDSISSVVYYGSCVTFQTLSTMLDQIGNKNIYPSFHASLAFLWCLARTPSSMKRVEVLVPWKIIATFLNTLTRNSPDFALIEGADFPSQGNERWLPEDFLIRGQIWSQHLYPDNFFNNAPTIDEGRNIEPPSRDILRVHRCLWFGVRLAMFNRWMTYDADARKFAATDFASQLDELAEKHSPFYGKGLQKAAEVDMHDT